VAGLVEALANVDGFGRNARTRGGQHLSVACMISGPMPSP
jgi:hypothetical protein